MDKPNMAYAHGLQKASEIVQNSWLKHNDSANKIINDPARSEQFFKDMAVCCALNDILQELNDEIEKSINEKEAV